jgi:succinylarginine dihydrolase
VLRAIFADERRFAVHDPLPAAVPTSDEGAANHTRFSGPHERDPGVDLFVHGRVAYGHAAPVPRRYPARQTREAFESIARRHGLHAARTLHVQQHADAIDAGVFHNDVIAVGQGRTLLVHERAWVDTRGTIAELASRVGPGFRAEVVTDEELSLDEAVATYLFNSQLLERPDGGLVLVAAGEVREHPRAAAVLARWTAPGGPIAESMVLDLRQSMQNGGGPACLRLRVPLTRDERAAIVPRVFLDEALASELEAWIRRHYRDRLLPADLADPALLDESRRALDELTRILALPPVYPFQHAAG